MVLVDGNSIQPGPTTTTGNLSITNSFAGDTPNRFGNVSLIVLNKSFEDVLKTLGFTATSNRSAIAAWGEDCKAQSPRCKQGTDAMKDSYVRMIKLDANGSTSFGNVPVQTFWLVAIVPHNNQRVVWNVKVDIAAGTNAIVFDQRNLATVY